MISHTGKADKKDILPPARAFCRETIVCCAMSMAFLWFSCSPSLRAGDIYSYVNKNGIKVFTNGGSRRLAATENGSEAQQGKALSHRGRRYDSYIREAASRNSLDPNLVKAIVAVESNFDPHAISNKGCLGLMQLHPETAQRFGVKNVFNPRENIQGGVRYLRFLMDHFNSNLKQVLAAYNAGENAVAQYGGIPPYPETKNYIKKVLTLYKPDGSRQDPAQQHRTSPRIYRVVLPDGRVVLTNTPSGAVG